MDFKKYIKTSFIVSAVISCITCYARADYNLPLFAFAYLLWDQIKPVKKLKNKNIFFIYNYLI